MSPMCASTCRVQHLSTLSIVSKSPNLPRNMQRRKNFSTSAPSLSFLGASCTICSFEDASMAHLEQLFDKDLTTPKRLWKQRCGKPAMWPCFQNFQLQKISHVSSQNCWGPAALHALHWASTKPTDLNLAEPQDWTNVKTGCSNGASIFWLQFAFLVVMSSG